MSIEALKLALEWIEAQPEPRMLGAVKVITALSQAIEQAEQCPHGADDGCKECYAEQAESYPPECQTDAEKTAYAFGWFKALESVRAEQAQQVAQYSDIISDGGLDPRNQFDAAPPPRQPDEVIHRQGCDALGGYGHGVGPCSCGATDEVPPPRQPWVGLMADDIRGLCADKSPSARDVSLCRLVDKFLKEKNT